jgi:putative transposase
MSRADNCYDNAFTESCFGTFELEMEMTEFDSVEAARAGVAGYVRYYRFERKHSSIGYLTPTQFATRTMTLKKALAPSVKLSASHACLSSQI